MELKSPYLKALPNFYKSSISCITSNSASPLIQIPSLKRPNRKLQSLPKIEIKSNKPMKRKNSSTTDVLSLMDSLHLPIPEDLYASLLKECTYTRDSTRGSEIHTHLKRSGLHMGLLLSNRLLLMYVTCGCLEIARQMFDKMTFRDSISWATMISGYIENQDHIEALRLFTKMEHKGFEFTSLIIVAVLKACIHTKDIELGKQIHGWVLKIGIWGSQNLFLGSLFIDFYGKFECLESARVVFDQVGNRDTVIWTTMIVGYCRGEDFEEVFEVFKQMGREGVKKNNYTFSSVLRACGRVKDDGQCGRQVHASAIKLGLESDLFVQSSLIDMYGKYGFLREARSVFEMTSTKRNDVCWNAMLTGYLQHGFCNEAIKFLYLMKAAGVKPPRIHAQ